MSLFYHSIKNITIYVDKMCLKTVTQTDKIDRFVNFSRLC